MTLLNSPVEVALRLLVILDDQYPRSRSIDELLLIDHVGVNSADFGGPASLHVATTLRAADLGARRDVLRAGMEILLHRELAEIAASQTGFAFRASENSHGFAGLMQSNYVRAFRDRVRWVSDAYPLETPQEVRALMSSVIERWSQQIGDDASN